MKVKCRKNLLLSNKKKSRTIKNEKKWIQIKFGWSFCNLVNLRIGMRIIEFVFLWFCAQQEQEQRSNTWERKVFWAFLASGWNELREWGRKRVEIHSYEWYNREFRVSFALNFHLPFFFLLYFFFFPPFAALAPRSINKAKQKRREKWMRNVKRDKQRTIQYCQVFPLSQHNDLSVLKLFFPISRQTYSVVFFE